MEHYEPAHEDRDIHHLESARSVNVMGMQVDKAWVHGLLESLPEEEQRQLSRLMLETISDTFPDLTRGSEVTPSAHNYDLSVTDGTSHRAHEQERDYREIDDEEDPDEDEDSENDVDYDNDDNEEDDSDEADGDDENEPDSDDDIDNSEADDYTGYHENNINQQLPQSKSRKHGKRGSYLNRFTSPRIRQGLTIWEELSVTIPAFMEDYVTAYAADAGMLVHQAGSTTGGLVTVHILFHLSHHRRPVCRLLDLVLEAEDGTLKKKDFMPGGAFADSDKDDGAAVSHKASEIDYDCSNNAVQHYPFYHSSHGYAMQGPIPMQANTNVVMHMQRSSPRRRA